MSRIGCAGILVADTFCGPMQALPKAGELLAIDAMVSSAGGCAANVAIDLALQGLAVEIAGCVGNDNAGNGLVAELEAFGVGCARIVRCADLPTSRTVILVTEDEDRRYIHTFGANAAFGVAGIDRNWVSALDLFYLGGLFALPAIDFPALAALLQHCRASGAITVVDVVVPGFRADIDLLDALLPHIDYFVPNHDEARVFTRLDAPQDQIRNLLDKGARTVIVTRGEDGAYAGAGGQLLHAPAYRLEAIDPSGSGDAFTAGVITAILRGEDLAGALKLACAMGASAAREMGTTRSVFRGDEAAAFVAAHPIDVKELQWK
jgi:sugar/nucleoside kinase (ribokinase family)